MFKSSLSNPLEMTSETDREIQNFRMRRRTVSESETVTRIARRRHSDFDDTWTRNFEPKEDVEEEEEVEEFGARSVPGEDLEGIFQFSAENSRSNSESATVAGPSDSEEDDDEMSVYGDARSRQTSFVRAAVI